VIWVCHECDRTIHGFKAEHCTACHQTFTSTEAGDKHRVGEHDVSIGPTRRRCMTVDELRAFVGKTSRRRFWHDQETDAWSYGLHPVTARRPPRRRRTTEAKDVAEVPG
jgi:hypothetical protein